MRNTIRFLVNDEPRELRSIDTNLTVLQYLRCVEKYCGTKEGCAEGDCGACTVVLGEIRQGKMSYRAINACIYFVSMLDGKQLITVEGLAGDSGQLHPVQKSMVECHGSQCGYCTPGFVMSMFAYYKQQAEADKSSLENALVGNLCRCTGYRPILEAGEKMFSEPGCGRFDDRHEYRILQKLKEIQSDGSLHIEESGQHFFAPTSLSELLELKAKYPEAHLLAGGTDLGLLVTKLNRRLSVLISLEKVSELHALKILESEVVLGASVTYAEAEPLLKEEFPGFYEVVLRLGSVQIRNLGTVGGNLVNASPIGDSAPSLMVLGARVRLVSARGERILALEDFFQDYRKTALEKDEVLAEILIPRMKKDSVNHLRVYKISKRFDQDISTLCGAFWIQISNHRVEKIRIAFGGMAATPKRAYQTEKFLQGVEWNEKTVHLAMEVLRGEFSPLSDFRGSAEYRQMVSGNLLQKFYLETNGADTRLGVLHYA